MEKQSPKRTTPKQKRGTTLTFSVEELTTLARYIVVAMTVLQTNHPVAGRIKGALTRLGLTSPRGL